LLTQLVKLSYEHILLAYLFNGSC